MSGSRTTGNIERALAKGDVDVEVVPAGPGAIRHTESEYPYWDAASVSLTVGNIHDPEDPDRIAVAEIGLLAAPYGKDQLVDLSIELLPDDIDTLIAALTAIRNATR